MTLTPEQRKRLVGFGGLSRVAKRLDVEVPAVSMTNSEKEGDSSERIRVAIAADILERHPQEDGHVCDDCRGLKVTPTNIWPKAATMRAPTLA